MASWCWVCHHKVNASYVYHKGDKCHQKCRELVIRKPYQCPICYRRFATSQSLTEHTTTKHPQS